MTEFTDFTNREIMRLVVGRRLGRGVARQVFIFEPDHTKVIKIEDRAQSFQNVLEWEAWQRAREVEHVARWLAPCHMISPCGSILIQSRTRDAFFYPEKLPAFLTDTKRSNYGTLGDRFVCHDYGMNLLMENGMTKRMRKVDWWAHDNLDESA